MHTECVYLKYKSFYATIFFSRVFGLNTIIIECATTSGVYYYLFKRLKSFHPLMTKFDSCFGDKNDNFSRKLVDKHFFGYWTLKLTFDMIRNCKLNFLIAGNWNFKHSLSVMNFYIENFQLILIFSVTSYDNLRRIVIPSMT